MVVLRLNGGHVHTSGLQGQGTHALPSLDAMSQLVQQRQELAGPDGLACPWGDGWAEMTDGACMGSQLMAA